MAVSTSTKSRVANHALTAAVMRDRASRNGVGLGLAVAKGFVEAMDGELAVEDTPGGGLTMVIGFEAAS